MTRHGRITVSEELLKRAGDEPTLGRQTYSALYPNGNPAEIAHGPVSVAKNFRNLDVSHGWVLSEAIDPLAAPLEAAKVERVDPGNFRTFDEHAGLLRPPFGRGFQFWRFRKRMATGSAPGAQCVGGVLQTSLRFGRHPFGDSQNGPQGSHGGTLKPGPDGMPTQRGDRRPVWLFGRGEPVGRAAVRLMWTKWTYFCSISRNAHADSYGQQGCGHYPTRESGLLSLPR